VRGVVAAALVGLLLQATPMFAQETKPVQKERKRKRELDDVFKRWLKEDVVYIISPEEKDAFNKLATDEEREAFIEQFWVRRDPDPDTPENPVREEHYRRIAYANEKFTSGIPGWKTDRGRVYIAWGPPDQLDSYPTGHIYQRPLYEGGGSTTTYAYEVWWYRHLDGVGDDIELEFVDPSGSGEYRIARNPEDKDALLYVANAGATMWEEMGMTGKAQRPYFTGDYNNRFYSPPANKTQFARIETWAKVQAGPGASEKFKDLRIVSDIPELEENALPFSLRTDFYRVSANSAVTALTMQVDHNELAFEEKGGVYSATVNIYAILRQLSGKGAGRFEEVIETPRYTDENIALGQQAKSLFQKDILLPPGNYRIEVIARDITSGKTGVVRQSFIVPRYQESRLGTSTVVLASSIENVGGRVAAGQFVIGKYKVLPNVTSVYKPDQRVGVFLHIYDTQIDQTTLRPAIDIEYVLLKDGREVRRVADSAADGIYDLTGTQMAVGELIPLAGLAPGVYTLQVRVTDRVAQKTVTPSADFTLVE
jgi:GWxTD domain-containing protein